MRLKIDPVTEWQKKVLGDIETLRNLGLGPNGGAPAKGVLSPFHENSLIRPVEENRSQPLPSSYFGPHGSSWGSQMLGLGGEIFGLGDDLPISLGSPQQMIDNALRQAQGLAINYVLDNVFNKEQLTLVTDRINQDLENRGYLEFVHNAGSNSTSWKLPFFSNPTISETRSATYSTHAIVNRNEPWRLFTGASAKQLQLTFTLTLPHIIEFAFAFSKEHTLKYIEGSEYYENFKEVVKEHLDEGTEQLGGNQSYQSLSNLRGNGEASDSRTYVPGRTATKQFVNGEEEKKFTGYIQYIVDMIRSSVLGSVIPSHSVAAPPIIKLKFGTLYDHYPCIVKSYSVKFDGNSGAGFDTNTLLPRQMAIQLSLEGFHQTDELHPQGREDYSTPEGWDTVLKRGDTTNV